MEVVRWVDGTSNETDLARVDFRGAEGVVVGTHLDRSVCPMLYLS